MTLKIAGDGRIAVMTNHSISEKTILDFVIEREAWIAKHLNKIPPQRQVKQGEEFYYFGKPLKLKFVITQMKNFFVSATDENLFIHWPMDQWDKTIIEKSHPEKLELIKKFYKREGERYLPQRAAMLSQISELYPQKINVRGQKSRWGSCNSRGHISLNWKLIFAPPEVIDYVIYHELCHLKFMNHSEWFWHLVSTHCVSYKIYDKWINKNHHLISFLN